MQYFNSEGFTYQLAISKSLDSAFTKTTNQQQLVFALSLKVGLSSLSQIINSLL